MPSLSLPSHCWEAKVSWKPLGWDPPAPWALGPRNLLVSVWEAGWGDLGDSREGAARLLWRECAVVVGGGFLIGGLGVFQVFDMPVIFLIISLPPFLPLLSLSFVQNYVPTVFENYTASFEIDTQRIELSLWDTSGKTQHTAWQSEPVRPWARDPMPCLLPWLLEGLPVPKPRKNVILSGQGRQWG